MSFADTVVARVLELEISLYHAQVRLAARTDGEALHDLRTGLRRLRGLLRPLGKLEGVAALDAEASELARLAGPARDLEVLAKELERCGLARAARVRRTERDRQCDAIIKDGAIKQLCAELELWLQVFRQAERKGQLQHLSAKVSDRMRRQLHRLTLSLAEQQYDPHRVRILVKRARYAAETYPRLSPVASEMVEALKRVQAALGDWHDRDQWIQAAAHSRELEPLRPQWQGEAEATLINAEAELLKLSRLLMKRFPTTRRSAEPGSAFIVYRVAGNYRHSFSGLWPKSFSVRV